MVEQGSYPDPDEPQALIAAADDDAPAPEDSDADTADEAGTAGETASTDAAAGSPGALKKLLAAAGPVASRGIGGVSSAAVQASGLARAYPRASIASGLSILVLFGVLSLKPGKSPTVSLPGPAGPDAKAAKSDPKPSDPGASEAKLKGDVPAPIAAVEAEPRPSPAPAPGEAAPLATAPDDADAGFPALPPMADVKAGGPDEPLHPAPAPASLLLASAEIKPDGNLPAPAPAPTPEQEPSKEAAPAPSPVHADAPEPAPGAAPPAAAPAPDLGPATDPLKEPAAEPAPAIPAPTSGPEQAAAPLPAAEEPPVPAKPPEAKPSPFAAFDLLSKPATPDAGTAAPPVAEPSPAAVAPAAEPSPAAAAPASTALTPVGAPPAELPTFPPPVADAPRRRPEAAPSVASTPAPAPAAEESTGDWVPIKHSSGEPRLEPGDTDLRRTDLGASGDPLRQDRVLEPENPVRFVSEGSKTATAAAAGAAAAVGTGAAAAATRSDGRMDTVLHKVQRGENFWTISRTHYASGRYYRALGKANADQFPNMKALYVGAVIRIPPPEDLDPALIDPPGGRSSRNRDPNEPEVPPVKTALPAGTTPIRRSGRVDGELNLPASDPDAGRTADRNDRRGSAARRRADEPETTAREAQSSPVHKVRPRETLRSIARDRLGDSRRAREILDLNRDVIDDPAHLVVGQLLNLPDDAE